MLEQLAALMNNRLNFNSSSLLQYYSTEDMLATNTELVDLKVLWNKLIQMKTKENLIGEKLLVLLSI